MPLTHFRNLWERFFPSAVAGQRSCTLTCRCGRQFQAVRQAAHQILRCPACGQPIFVLPIGSFRPPGWQRPDASPPPRATFLWIGLALVSVTLFALLGVYFLIRYLAAPVEPVPDHTEIARQEILQVMTRARRDFDEGRIHLARISLDQAIALRDEMPRALTEPEHRRLNQLQRQAALLTDLAPVSLLAMLDQAEKAAGPADWQARFRHVYQGKSILFDDVMRADRDRRILSRRLADLRVGNAFGRVALEELKLVQELPLQEPQRWILGARLRSIDREGSPTWIIRLEPESGVLITERAPLEAELPNLRDDPDWPLILTRQQSLLETLPAPRPHRP